MLDPKLLRTDLNALAEHLATRGFKLDIVAFQKLEEERKALQLEVERLQQVRNEHSRNIGKAKARGENVESVMQEMQAVNQTLDEKKQSLNQIQQTLEQWQLEIPNLPDVDVPIGKTEDDNVELHCWGEKPEFTFDAKDHVDVGEKLGLDLDIAAIIARSRFCTLQGQLARLHRALIQFMLDTHTTEHGYQEVYVPYLVNSQSLQGTGQLPKFADDLFKISDPHDLYLIPTAEVPVTNLVRDQILKEEQLPLKFVAHTPCFRSEAGSYGKDTRGLIRQHQFEKVELVQIVKSHESLQKLEELCGHAEVILQKLVLPYRKMALCTGDLGFSAAKTYDLEVWLPSQQCYREISSCSNFRDFQARRLKARWKNSETSKNELVHTLNGSGLAVGRTLVAILENYQDENGNVVVPDVLRSYMNGCEKITV